MNCQAGFRPMVCLDIVLSQTLLRYTMDELNIPARRPWDVEKKIGCDWLPSSRKAPLIVLADEEFSQSVRGLGGKGGWATHARHDLDPNAFPFLSYPIISVSLPYPYSRPYLTLALLFSTGVTTPTPVLAPTSGSTPTPAPTPTLSPTPA